MENALLALPENRVLLNVGVGWFGFQTREENTNPNQILHLSYLLRREGKTQTKTQNLQTVISPS